MSEKLEFHFKGGIADTQQLPAEYIMNLLSNIKKLMHLLVSQSLGIVHNERFKPSKEIRDNYVIKCEIPKSGSYALPIEISSLKPALAFNPCENIWQMFRNVNESKEEYINNWLPNPKMRTKALSCVRDAFPQYDSDIHIEIVGKSDDATIIDSRSIQKNITAMIDKAKEVVEKHMTVVTGYLTGIDFAEKKIIIRHPATQRTLDCFYNYNEEIEDMLLENRRQLVQITGIAELDDNEHPKKISDAINIQEIDLSPIEIDCVNFNGNKLIFKNRLILTPELDDSEQFYIIDYPDIGLNSFAYTRQELADGIKSDIASLWEEYALASDGELAEDAKILKDKLLDAIKEERQ